MEKDRNLSAEQADFWDISALTPPRKSAYRTPTPADTEAVEISVPPVKRADTTMGGTVPPQTDVPLPRRPVAREASAPPPVPERSYRPHGSLLFEVRVYPHKNEYGYYAAFCRHARRLAALEGTSCAHEPFFSYMPQYSQMTRPQLAFYLWWRTCLRQGRAIEADYSYLLLYLYEIINLGDAIDPKTGQEMMLRLWLSYREKYPRLDALVREWLVDYSLLYELPPPALPRVCLQEMIGTCRLKEFYVSAGDGDLLTDAVLAFASNYDYKKSKFYRDTAVPHYDRVMRGATRETLSYFKEDRAENASRIGAFSTITRDTFSGAVCAYPFKKRIEVDFASFSHTYELRYIVTDVLKYAENALRAALGIKSRLTVYEVSVALRARLDAYLAQSLPKGRASRAAREIPAYEKRYDVPVAPISPHRAAKIEAASWQTTKRLIEAFDAKEEVSAPAASSPAASVSDPVLPTKGDATLLGALGELLPFFALADHGDREAQREFAKERGCMLDAIADRINTVATEKLGDVILEEVDGAYRIIEDYRLLLREEGILL